MISITNKEYAALLFAAMPKDESLMSDSSVLGQLHKMFFLQQYNKFLFSDSCVVRAMNINIDKVPSESLTDLYFKTGEERGIVMLSNKYEKINFQYAITPTQIILGVFVGTAADVKRIEDTDKLASQVNDIHAGDVIINASGITYIPNSVLSMLVQSYITKNPDMVHEWLKDPFLGKQVRLAYKELAISPDGLILDDPIRAPFLYNENARIQRLQAQLQIAAKCFIFLKCASVVDKTFVSGKSTMCTYRRRKKEKNIDYIYVDGHYDQSVSVTYPFKVSGHFRNQPKKKENGEWYTELIYIDSFMKKGYTRKATKQKIEES